MIRTDSGFEEYPRQQKSSQPEHVRRSSFSETAEQSTTHLPGRCTPDSRRNDRHSSATTPERPALKTRRSRPNSKHSARSNSRSSAVYPRPALSTRVRSLPADLPLRRSDIDSVLALHSRSCSLFHSSAPQSPRLSPLGRFSADYPPQDSRQFYSIPSPAVSTFSSHLDDVAAFSDDDEDHQVSTPTVPPPTVIHWNSPTTRRREYAEIDKSTTGFRGFMRRVTPRWLSRRPPRQAFYGGEKDDDACSVRRYRVALPEDDMSTINEKERPMSAPIKIAKLWKCS